MKTTDLREPAFWILAALAEGRQHGYALIRETSALSGGAVSLAVTTLYASLDRLVDEGLVSTDGDEVVDGRLRRYFVATPEGRARLQAEAERLEQKVAVVRRQLSGRTSRPVRPATTGGIA